MTTEPERLAALAQYDLLGTDIAEMAELSDLQALCELAARLLEAPNAVVNIIDDRLQHQIAAFGCEPTSCEREDSMCWVTLRLQADVLLADASSDSRYAALPWVDGREGSVRFYASSLLTTSDGQPLGALCVFDEVARPVTDADRRAMTLIARQVMGVLELRARTRRLAVAVAELSRSQEQLAAFAGQLSHDLKTPLTAILGFTELLLDSPGIAADETATTYLERCESSGRRMLAMIQTLLAYARIGGSLEVRPVSLAEVMPQVLDDLASTLADGRVDWTPGSIPADPTQLRALLQNLVGNALVYRRAGVPAVVRIEIRNAGDAVELRVIDNGDGIPADKRSEAMQPLTRLRTDVPGAGLGLATCARIVGAHGGTMALSDTPGGGTTVTVVLPNTARRSARLRRYRSAAGSGHARARPARAD